MNFSSHSSHSLRRRAAAIGLIVGGVAIASAVASSDLDVFTDVLHTVAQRYSIASVTTQAATVVAAAPSPPTRPAPVVTPSAATFASRTVTSTLASAAGPLPLARIAARAPSPTIAHPSPARATAVGGASIAAEYHLPTPTIVGRHDEPAFPTFRTTAVADDEGRAVELADAAPVPVLPPAVVIPTPTQPNVAPASGVAPAVAEPAVVTTVETITRGRGPAESSPVTVVGAGVPDVTGWVPSAGVQPDGAPGELAWETIVDTGSGLGSGGVRGATTPGWTPGTGVAQDVIVNADGSITVLPEPTTLLALTLAGGVFRRRR